MLNKKLNIHVQEYQNEAVFIINKTVSILGSYQSQVKEIIVPLQVTVYRRTEL
jgi:hypothetical protein